MEARPLQRTAVKCIRWQNIQGVVNIHGLCGKSLQQNLKKKIMFICTCNPLTFTFDVDIIYLLNTIKRSQYTIAIWTPFVSFRLNVLYVFFIVYITQVLIDYMYHRRFWDISEVQQNPNTNEERHIFILHSIHPPTKKKINFWRVY